uniref:Uncharacterized protein n=1 Tax=Trichogramma kaykai TaxID=54128 RepID=A0ABD2VT92_9HYME
MSANPTSAGKTSKACVLLQSTTYPMNNSCSKFATVGLEFYDGEYRPAVQISSASKLYNGIVLNSVGWRMIRDNMYKIMAYTYESSNDKSETYAPDRIEIEGYSIDFTIMHNIKSVQFTRKVFDPLPEKYKRMLAAKEAEISVGNLQPRSAEQSKEANGASEKITELSSPTSPEKKDASVQTSPPDTTTRESESGAMQLDVSAMPVSSSDSSDVAL